MRRLLVPLIVIGAHLGGCSDDDGDPERIAARCEAVNAGVEEMLKAAALLDAEHLNEVIEALASDAEDVAGTGPVAGALKRLRAAAEDFLGLEPATGGSVTPHLRAAKLELDARIADVAVAWSESGHPMTTP